MKKLPSNWESKRKRLEWEEAEEEKKRQCAEKGVEYDRAKMLDVQADDAERWDAKKRKKKNPDEGFSGKRRWCSSISCFGHCCSIIKRQSQSEGSILIFRLSVWLCARAVCVYLSSC